MDFRIFARGNYKKELSDRVVTKKPLIYKKRSYKKRLSESRRDDLYYLLPKNHLPSLRIMIKKCSKATESQTGIEASKVCIICQSIENKKGIFSLVSSL